MAALARLNLGEAATVVTADLLAFDTGTRVGPRLRQPALA